MSLHANTASRGFHVARVLMPAGMVETACASAHIVSLHVGAAIHAECRRDRGARSGLQCPGDIEIITAGERGRWVDDEPADTVQMRIQPTFLNSVAAGLGLDPRRVELTPHLCVHDSELEHIGRALERAFARAEGRASLVVDSLGVALGALLIERFAKMRFDLPACALTPRQLRAVLDYIEENLTSPLLLRDLADVAGVSVSHFKALFRNAKGAPAHRYVVHRRVERAAALIKKGDLPLSQIALEAGFAHQSHLARAMRRVMGVTPGNLARAHR